MAQDDNFFNESDENNPNIQQPVGNSGDRSTVNGLGIAGLVVGIIGLLVSFIPCFGLFALFIGILGIVLSGIGLYMANKGKFEKGLVIAGLVISILATMIALFQWTVAGAAISQADKESGTLIERLEEINKENQERLDREMEEMQNEQDSLDGNIVD